MNWRFLLRRSLFSLTVAVLSGCDTHYAVDMVNYGRNGVLIIQAGRERAQKLHPYYSKHGVDFPIIRGIYPSIPSEYRNPANAFGRFVGYESRLPGEVEIVWQLANLKDCEDEFRMRDWSYSYQKKKDLEWLERQGFDPDGHVKKSGCTWVPLNDKIFRKQLDMRVVKDSEAYRRAASYHFERHIVFVELVFNEDQLLMNTYDHKVNFWK